MSTETQSHEKGGPEGMVCEETSTIGKKEHDDEAGIAWGTSHEEAPSGSDISAFPRRMVSISRQPSGLLKEW